MYSCIRCNKDLPTLYGDSSALLNGTSSIINANYGSNFDSMTYEFFICDDCVRTLCIEDKIKANGNNTQTRNEVLNLLNRVTSNDDN